MKINDGNKKNYRKKNSMKKDLLYDEEANFSIMMAGLLLIGFLILSMVILNTSINHNREKEEIISSNQFKYIMNDYTRNIPLIEREALAELGEAVIKNKRRC